jgi:phenylalanyl-tRNA synthetase beta chain
MTNENMNILIPDSWLREYLDTSATPDQIKNCLSLCGPSVEQIKKVGNDIVYEIEITSNRVDMVSVYGIAREAAAILPRFGLKTSLKNLKSFSLPTLKESEKLPMIVSDPRKICHRIMGVVMTVDKMNDSPTFIKERLEKSGVRSLNNLVDITNYVMLELGHPCHVFDYDRIRTHKFLIRFAKKGELIITLDEKKYLLSNEDVIIDDGTGRVIDLPGIMGTENSVVNQNTRRIFFFIESNNPLYIRRTSMRYGIRTMASAINEKHPDPELVKTTLFRGIELYQKLAGGKIASPIIDIYPNPPKPKTIKISADFINERLGIELKAKEIIDILRSLRFDVILNSFQDPHKIPKQVQHDTLIITPPSFRQFDVIIPEDIVEEVARIYGYHNLPSKLMTGEIPVSDKPKILSIEEKIKQILKYWGFTEIYNYSFISKELITKSQLQISDHLKIANPLSEETEYMRISLIPSMLETIAKNQPYSDNLQLFELANVYVPSKAVKTPGRWPKDSFQVEEAEIALPHEYPMLAITNQKDFYQLKGLIETLLRELGIQNVILSTFDKLSVNSAKNPVGKSENVGDPSPAKRIQDDVSRHFWHPKQTICMEKNGKVFAMVGRIHPALIQNFQIKNHLYLAILNVELISQLSNPAESYIPIPLYPAVIEDMAISYPTKTYIGPIISEILKISKIVKKVEIVDRYENSTTLRITYQDINTNLTNEEIKVIRLKILQLLKTKFNASLKQ